MNANWIKFLLIALVIMAICLGGLGGWLLPRLGIEGAFARGLAAGLGGAAIAILYIKMIKKPGDA